MANISKATILNFQKLNKDLENHKFVSRANKRDSKKHILPLEYFSSKKNRDQIENMIMKISDCGDHPLSYIVESLIFSYFKKFELVTCLNNQIKYKNTFIENFCSDFHIVDEIANFEWPNNEIDPIGLIYQYLMTEGEKNVKGSYYTPENIISRLVDNIEPRDETVCDPCCGSGSFLLHMVTSGLVNPEKVFGYDIDENAVKIARANLFIKNPLINYNERILCADFLKIKNVKYDNFITNPPWGSMTNKEEYSSFNEITSGESFSYFLIKCLKSLGKGKIVFLLPISFLNVRVHSDVRSFILSNYSLNRVYLFGKCFKGVLTDVVGVHISHKNDLNYYEILKDNEFYTQSVSLIKKEEFYVIPYFDQIVNSIISKMLITSSHNLKKAEFALGIVTGNNKELLLSKHVDGSRPIVTGKDVNPVYLSKPKNFVFYDRKKFQQVCDDKFFAASSKLIYKFISKRLCFACDKSSMLSLNSANILIPPTDFYLSDVCLAGILSSSPLNFYFMNKINQIKVLKEDIRNLPLPDLSSESIKELEKICTKAYIKNIDALKDINKILYLHYGFTSNEISKIEETVYGRIN